MRGFVSIAAFTLALLVGSQAIAQQPPANPPSGGTPDAMPFDIPYGTPITAERAKQILAAAEAEAKKRNWKMNIAVVDTHGDLVNFLRMDSAQIASVAISQVRRAPRHATVARRKFSITPTKAVIRTFQPSIPRWSRLQAASRWSRAAS
jgi:uncharacterized protein GlcG (DUF336 family)